MGTSAQKFGQKEWRNPVLEDFYSMRVASKKEGNSTLSNQEKSRYSISSGQLLRQIF